MVLVRHGESRWNLCNRFTGWVDVPLSENGVKEAQRCAAHCKQYQFKAVYTSVLSRAESTCHIILSAQGSTGIVQHKENRRYGRWIAISNHCSTADIPVFESMTLNERYYGDLQGMDKDMAEKKYGREKVFAWRRGYTSKPPGGGESLQDVVMRTLPFVKRNIIPRMKRREEVLLVAHGNTLRAVIKFLENLSAEEIAFIDLPEAHPIVYSYEREIFKRVRGEYTFNRPLR